MTEFCFECHIFTPSKRRGNVLFFSETEIENRKRLDIEFQQARNSWRDLEQEKDQEIQAVAGEMETLKAELKTTQEQLSSEKASELRALHEELDQVTEEMNKNREEMDIRLCTLETENSEKSSSLEEFTKTCQRLNIELTAMEEKLLETTRVKNLAEEEYRTERTKLKEEISRLVAQVCLLCHDAFCYCDSSFKFM